MAAHTTVIQMYAREAGALQLGCEMEMAETSGGLSGGTVKSTRSIGKGS